MRGERDQVRSVVIRTETGQVSSATFRALDAMAQTRHELSNYGLCSHKLLVSHN